MVFQWKVLFGEFSKKKHLIKDKMPYRRIAGQVYTVNQIVYELPDEQYQIKQPWQIYSTGDVSSQIPKIRLTFQPWGSQEEHINTFIVAADFVQAFGMYNGTIELFDHTYVIENGFGVAENHYAKW
jgi:hypothetical protein